MRAIAIAYKSRLESTHTSTIRILARRNFISRLHQFLNHTFHSDGFHQEGKNRMTKLCRFLIGFAAMYFMSSLFLR